jgi:hypothetical protein
MFLLWRRVGFLVHGVHGDRVEIGQVGVVVRRGCLRVFDNSRSAWKVEVAFGR